MLPALLFSVELPSVELEIYLFPLFSLCVLLFRSSLCLSLSTPYPRVMDLQPQINALIQQTSSLECTENYDTSPTTMDSEYTLL